MADNPSQYAWDQPVDEVSTSKYPYNNTLKTRSGHLQEFDDTPGAERIRIQHKSTTYMEMRADGDNVVSVAGDGYEIVAKDKNVSISGHCFITINGDSILEVKGNCKQRIKGNFTQLIEGDYDQVIKGKTSISSGGNMNVGVMSAGGKIKVTAGTSLTVNSDLTVNGGLRADVISSEGAIAAGSGIHAGIPGSVNPMAGITTLGGINCGVAPGMATVPGVARASVMVTAPSVVGTVITYGSILMDPLGGTPLIRAIYNSHQHIGNQGRPTSQPIQPMPMP